MNKVFLGGTCNGSTWRDKLIPELTTEYFDPVVTDWNEAAQQAELQARKDCDLCLYVITPRMTGVYSIAEVTDDSNKRPDKTVFYIYESAEDGAFTEHQLKSLNQVGRLVQANGATWFTGWEDLIKYLNS